MRERSASAASSRAGSTLSTAHLVRVRVTVRVTVTVTVTVRVSYGTVHRMDGVRFDTSRPTATLRARSHSPRSTRR
jgi:hypothetical protein